MIVTLAGHVDHGKTSLVHALTGVDTDSLAEEKRRGLTIDIGFAYADIEAQRIGFVDVPGHHRFIHNMVAGVAAHQLALVAVAADDGVMPQTREHLAILKLLGVTEGILAITKIDRVDVQRTTEVADAAAALCAAFGITLRAIVRTSTISGEGVDTLREQIAEAARHREAIAAGGEFRLAVDRAFVVKGSGVVVTGTVHSGVVAKGTEVAIAPAGTTARVRSLRVSDQEVDHAQAGDRCAVNLGGIAVSDITRGDWLVAPAALAPTYHVQLRLAVLDDFPRALKHWLPVHAYHAASHAEGHVALLDAAPIAPGCEGFVELVLNTPLHPKHGDRLVLRDHALQRTIGGGTVIDTAFVARGRRAPERVARLAIAQRADAITALAGLLDLGDVDLTAFKRARNLTAAEYQRVIDAVAPHQVQRGGTLIALHPTRWSAALDTLAAQIAAYHKTAPHSPGLKVDQIRRMQLVPKQWLDAALAQLIASSRIRESAGHFFAPTHRPQLPPDDAALLKRIETLISSDGQPPSSGDMAKTLGINLRTIDAFVGRMAKLGLLVRVGSNRVLTQPQLDTMATLATKLAQSSPDGFSARAFRDAAAIGRNLAIDVLEYFDHCGFTRRYGDLRRIVGAVSTLRRA